jgi:hypothetical protein
MTRVQKNGVRTPSHPAAAATPTDQTYGPLQAAFRHFNRELFNGELPAELFTLQRRANTKGYFSPDRFVAIGGEMRIGEIAMNPAYFVVRTPIDTCSTLVHEMAHAWREMQAKPPRSGYHDKLWAAKMREVGLQPSSTEAPGGKETGYRVSHYIVPDAPFALSYARLEATGVMIGWGDAMVRGQDAKPAKPKRFKFICPSCGANVHGREATDVRCNPCDVVMEMATKAQAMVAGDAIPPGFATLGTGGL